MLFGCIPVVSDIPTHREYVQNSGFYFNPLDQNSFCTSLSKAIAYTETIPESVRTQMKKNVIQNFSPKVLSKLWENILFSISLRKS